jgi:hypothetical protein
MLRSKFFLWTLLIAALPLNAWAVDKDVTISWTMSDTTDVLGYKMYYSYDSSMANRQLACETSDSTATTLTCPNVNLEQSPIYFAIAAITTDSEASSSAVAETLITGISIVQGFRLETSSGTTPVPVATFSKAINFQPANSPIPEGYIADSADVFDETSGYGWNSSYRPLDGLRDRNNPLSPSQDYDTLVVTGSSSVWEYALENRTYRVTICLGDPTYPDSTNNIQVEGVNFFTNEQINTDQRWAEHSQNISVNDGKLTLTFTGSTPFSQICWLKIESTN